MKRVIIATLALAALGSCAKEESTAIDPSIGDGVVTFALSQIASRTVGNNWVNLDEVGIYMSDAESSSDNRTNVRYVSDANGNFSIYSGVTPIYYPQSEDDKVNFNAYYPYDGGAVTNNLTEINITKQNSDEAGQGAVDFMTAEITDASKSSAKESFDFYHRLSMLVLELTHNNELSTLAGVVTKVKGVNSVADFNVLTGDMSGSSSGEADITFAIDSQESDGSEMIVSAILLPESLAKGTQITFTQGTDTYTLTLADAMTLEKGTKYTCTVVVGRDTLLATGDSVIEDWYKEDADNLYSKE